MILKKGKDTANKNIVFVYMGNTCRSPMAEGIFRELLRENGIEDVECASRGLDVDSGALVKGNTVRAAKAYGADISGHQPRQLSRILAKRGDLFVCMTEYHAQELTTAYEVPQDKVTVLNIEDPYGGDEMKYTDCAYDIHDALSELIKKI